MTNQTRRTDRPAHLRHHHHRQRAALAVLCLPLLLAAAGCSRDTPQSYTESGRKFLDKKDPAAAAIQFKSALQLDAKQVPARVLLGRALLEAGDLPGALIELNRALDQGAPASDVVPMLSRALLLTGDDKKLTGTYGTLTLPDKRAQAELKTNLAASWGALGDRDKTVAATAAALAADPDYAPAQVMQARLLAGEGKFSDALALLVKVNASDPRLVDAWLLKGEILDTVQRDAKAAGEAFRQALTIEPRNAQAHVALIQQSIRIRDFATARKQAEALRAVQPKHPLTVFLDAQLAFLDGKPQVARDGVQKLLRAFPSSGQLLVLAGAVESQLNNLMQAEAHLSKAVQLNPQGGLARRNLAEVYVRLGQSGKAIDVLKPMLELPKPEAEVLSLAGDAELRQGNAAAAESYFQRAAKAAPDNVRLQTAVALAQMSRGDSERTFGQLQSLSARSSDTYADDAIFSARMKRREYTQALAALDVIAKKQPDRKDVAELRGRVQIARQDYPAARSAFEQAIQRDAGNFSAVMGLVAADVAENKLDLARKRLDEAIKAEPRNTYALLALAEVRARANAPLDEVKRILGDAIKLAPTDSTARLALINYTLQKKQFKDALVAAREAASAMPDDPRVLDAVARAQLASGDVEQAITTYRRIAANEVNAPMAYVRLASIFNAAGRRPQAESALNKALELRPDLVAAQVALVDLLQGSGRRNDALAFTRKMQADRRTQLAGYLLEASIHERAKAVDLAAAAYRNGLAKVDDSELARGLYRLLLDNNRGPAAEQFGAGWIKAHPDDAAFEYLLAGADINQNRLPLAVERLTRVLAAYPDNALAHNNMAWVQMQMNKPGALDHAKRAAELAPNQAPILDTLASALLQAGQSAPALTAQRQAIQLAPQDQMLRLNLARIAVKAGDKATARTELERLKALGAGFPQQDEVGRLLATL